MSSIISVYITRYNYITKILLQRSFSYFVIYVCDISFSLNVLVHCAKKTMQTSDGLHRFDVAQWIFDNLLQKCC